MVATESGYLALIRRCHGIGMNISTDGGLNWDEGTMIDYTTSFNGSALEVEPDVVLVAYPEVVKVLLEHEADISQQNNKGQLPTATVETPWQEIKPLYGFIGSMLQMKFDTNRIEKERVIVAELLKKHATDQKAGQSPGPAPEAP